jgi:lipopolysaccharide transport system ATP-binding protein
MGKPVLSFEAVTKHYQRGVLGKASLAHDIDRWWRKWRYQEDIYRKVNDTNTTTDFLALNDVSFEIQAGDVVGIVGANGAGKSTLLKLAAKIITPSKGTIRIKGKVASIIEIGTGFHPELTGRENIMLSGTMLGMTKRDILKQLNAIIDFSGVAAFIDTPVKRYSSGMHVRLAFAVAAHLSSDILLIDEVLAVGDYKFQEQCFGSIEAANRQQGRTILFVSHSTAAVRRLCTKGLLLAGGQLRLQDNIHAVLQAYAGTTVQQITNEKIYFTQAHRRFDLQRTVAFVSMQLHQHAVAYDATEPIDIVVAVKAAVAVANARFAFTIMSVQTGLAVGTCFLEPCITLQKGEAAAYVITLQPCNLTVGNYYTIWSIGYGNHLTGISDVDHIQPGVGFTIKTAEEGIVWSADWGNVVLAAQAQRIPTQ